MTNVLLTFTGFHDPFSRGLVGEEDQPGPILSLAAAHPFDVVILLSTPATQEITSQTQAEIANRHPSVEVRVRDVPLDDPTDYTAILAQLRQHIVAVQDDIWDGVFFIAVASGTPQMHAVWVLLAAGGEIPAKLLHVRPPRFVTRDRPLVSEIDLTSDVFPTVRARISTEMDSGDSVVPDAGVLIRQLSIVGDHPSVRKALEVTQALADSAVPILIRGETGTGKELFARLVHIASGRPRDRFVPVNCAAIPEDLVESVLFGHRKGAFTGAIQDQRGKFDLADGGTLFLDELGELPMATQAKLLRVLQDGIVEPVGAEQGHQVDVRIVAATNRDVAKAIRKGEFREDLYYRLCVGEILLPPLRERRSDIPKLALHLLDRINATIRHPKRLSQDALARLQSHSWLGNVRDLENVIERSARLCRGDVLDADDLLITEPIAHADPLDALPEPEPGFSMDHFLSGARKQLILRAMEIARGNQSEAARLLGVTPQAVSKFLREDARYNRICRN